MTKGQRFGFSISQTDLRDDLMKMDKKVAKLIESACAPMNKAVIEEVARLVEPYVPKDTGNLASNKRITKDRYSKNGYILGWTTPYAKVNYFGVKAQYEFRRLDGKNTKVFYQKHGIPFWDRPITRNKALMTSIYEKEAKKILANIKEFF